MRRIPGLAFFPDDEELLVELIIVDEEQRGNWYGVTEDVVREACNHFDLPFERVMEIIQNKDRSVHSIYINVPDYKAYLETI